MRRVQNQWPWIVGFTVALAGAWLPVRADDASEVRRLYAQFQPLYNANRLREAEPIAKQIAEIAERSRQLAATDLPYALNNLAMVYDGQNRVAEAEPLFKRSLQLAERLAPRNDAMVASFLGSLAGMYRRVGRYAEAEPLLIRQHGLLEKVHGPNHPNLAECLVAYGQLDTQLGRYADAEARLKRGIALSELKGGSAVVLVAGLNNLAVLYFEQARYAEIESLYKRALDVSQQQLGPGHVLSSVCLNNLAQFYTRSGRYAEAEPLMKTALAQDERVLGPEHPNVATRLNNLGLMYLEQGRLDEAEPLLRRALEVNTKALGPGHVDVAIMIGNLAMLRQGQGNDADAEEQFNKAVAIATAAVGAEHPAALKCLNNLGVFYRDHGRLDEAVRVFERVIKAGDKAFGANHPILATYLCNLARIHLQQGRPAVAEPLADRAVRLADQFGGSLFERFESYEVRARILWTLGDKHAALADLRKALDLAENQRNLGAGGGRELAHLLNRFRSAFEGMVSAQAQMGDVGEALTAIERSHARSLIDDINLAGADLDAGRSPEERQQLRQREGELKARVALWERQLAAAATDAERERIGAQLAKAREAVYQHDRDARSSSPIYRNLVSSAGSTPRVRQLQRQLVGAEGLMLVYFFGEDNGYVAAIGPETAQLTTLTVDEGGAQTLHIEPGPLTVDRLQSALTNPQRSGVSQLLADPQRADSATAQLAVLWNVLVPADLHGSLTDGTVKRLIVVPHGPLAMLPFETLVVENDETPRFLLDAGPPILYGPSATVLFNLSQRAIAPTPAGLKPVLTVGEPLYAPSPAPSRIRLAPLPHSGVESLWVAEAFTAEGITVGRLARDQATEAAVRYNVPGRRFVHLACHGLADQSFGNYFGSLALTPGPQAASHPADDGYLTLAEIYALDLRSCELAILSACETNFGPQQQGEGVWALSRGFFVAGARRVAASNWLVDDEAMASLVSVFCGGVAQGHKAGQTDYAAALQRAKRWVRQQSPWSAPYYWGSFVLLGPN